MEQPARDYDEVREAVDQYELPLTQFATRIVGDPSKARDIVQEVFLRLWEVGSERVEGRMAEWLFTVCRNRAIDVLRRDQRLTSVPDIDRAPLSGALDPPWKLMQRQQDVSALVALVAELPGRKRRLIVMRFHNGWSYRQISEETGLSVSNVGYLIHTTVKQLRERFTANCADGRRKR